MDPWPLTHSVMLRGASSLGLGLPVSGCRRTGHLEPLSPYRQPSLRSVSRRHGSLASNQPHQPASHVFVFGSLYIDRRVNMPLLWRPSSGW
ncbi:hypothetical protein BKA81DRAFT_364277, partial [Phyllosticta paracitricarpa]